MNFQDLLPSGVCEIPFLYLSLPDLLSYMEIEDFGIKSIISKPEFWKRKIREDYPSFEGNCSGRTYQNIYYDLYVDEAIQDGFVFELGLLRFPLTKGHKDLIDKSRCWKDYLAGFYASGCGYSPGLLSIHEQGTCRILASLHRGEIVNRKELNWELLSQSYILLSEEIIDSLIRIDSAPETIFKYLLRRTSRHPAFRKKDVILLNHLLQNYEFSREIIFTAIEYLNNYLQSQSWPDGRGQIFIQHLNEITIENVDIARKLLISYLNN